MQYTPEQLAVINHYTGPLCVVAAAGSGKTSVLTARIANLISGHAVPPSAILGLTFTRAAAEQMRERLAEQVGPSVARRVALRTFHGLAYSLLFEAGGKINVWGEGQPLRALGAILRELGLPADQAAVQACETDLANFRGRLADLTAYRPVSCSSEHFRMILARYQEAKQRAGALDFDDLLEETLHRLSDDADWRAQLRSRWRFVLVDEFQDTNLLQSRLLEQLISADGDLMVVGDDDQAIYGWRGSEVRFILDFPHRHTPCRVLILPTNFRTSAALLAPAARLIGRNRQRFAKALTANRGGGQAPEIVRPETCRDEDDQLLRTLTSARDSGANLNDYAVLYRQHMQAFGLITRLERACVPCRLLAGDADPFATWPARDALAYLRWAWGEASLEEITRILRRPLRGGMTKDAVAALESAVSRPAEALAWLAGNAPAAARELQGAFETLRHVPAERALDIIRYELDYDSYIGSFCAWSGADRREAEGLLESLQAMPEAGESSRAYLELARTGQASGRGRRDRRLADGDGAPAVTLTTFHSAKGLEWEHVFIKGALEGLTPTKQAVEGNDQALLEEERRLFYVAMTRAKERLTIFCPRRQNGSTAQASRFVCEAGLLPADQSTSAAGQSPRNSAGRGAKSGGPVIVGRSRPRAKQAPASSATNEVLDLTLTHRLKKLQGAKYFVPNDNAGRYYKQPALDGAQAVLYRGSVYRQCVEIEPDALLDMLKPADRD